MTKRVFLYAEFQNTLPFEQFPAEGANALMKDVPGLLNKTWLSGLNTHSVGGFYEFADAESARAYENGLLREFANQAGGSLTVRLFDGDVVGEASRQMGSPFYGPAAA